MNGIIYKYTSPNGKVYIGQTLNENRRKKEFLKNSIFYAGKKIDNARKKYGPSNFTYEVLFKKEYKNEKESIQELNELEMFYIKKYDSIKNGYNMTDGGNGTRGLNPEERGIIKMKKTLKEYYKTHPNPFLGHKHSKETIEKLKKIAKGRPSPFKGKHWNEEQKKQMSEKAKLKFKGEGNPFFGHKHNENTKKIISNKNSVSVTQIDKNTNEIIKVYPSALQASMELTNKPKGNSEIVKVCKGYISPKGKKYITALGFKWKYTKDIEGSTTIEKD